MNRIVGIVAVASLLTASPSMAGEEQKSLYDRLGGVYAIATVVDEFIDRLLVNSTLNANPAIDAARKEVPPAGLKYRVTAFMSQAAGGPQVYTGRDMVSAHAHLNITEREWRAMIADLEAVLYKFNVPDKERQEVLDLVGTLKGQVVTAEE